MTIWLICNATSSVEQGCKLSPTLVSVYIINSITEIKTHNCGNEIQENVRSTFLCFDIVLIAPDEASLHVMLQTGVIALHFGSEKK